MSSVALMSLETARVGAWENVSLVAQFWIVTGYRAGVEVAPDPASEAEEDDEDELPFEEPHPASRATAIAAAAAAEIRPSGPLRDLR
jgi:hypothetical protein